MRGVPVLASDASACTLEFFTSRSQIQTTPLTPIVLSMIAMAGIPLFDRSVRSKTLCWHDHVPEATHS